MAKTIYEMAIDYRQDFIENGVNKDVANDHKDSFEIGANAVLEEIETYINNLDLGNSAEEKFYKLDAIADIGLYIKQLKR